MLVSHVKLKNWRNFREVNVPLRNRIFLVGPNACGKSNFLDVFRFLRDITKKGLQQAVNERKGLSKIRCLAARQAPDVEIEIQLANNIGDPVWKYAIGLKQESRGNRQPYLAYERVWEHDKLILDRPDGFDKNDVLRLTQTHLEQVNANQTFREIANALQSICYLHLVPQLVRNPDIFSGPGLSEDSFGRNFLERVAKTPEKQRRARLRKIQDALLKAVPQLKELSDVKDESGIPHLEVVYKHWRPMGARQREDQFSDGTLRLIGLFWSLLDGDALLLLEEPELSLNAAIVRMLPTIIHRLQKKNRRQVMISTHSADLLSDQGIAGEEILLMTPSPEGTQVCLASSVKEIKKLLNEGLTPAEAILPYTQAPEAHQLEFAFNE